VIAIRRETQKDITAIHNVNAQAFGQKVEADLVDALRVSGALTLSLVALVDKEIVGHMAFSPVMVESSNDSFDALGLGPMAVLPGYQKKGIGSSLVEKGLRVCQKEGHEIIFVLGYPEFYSRFGFLPSHIYGIKCEYDVPDDVFMVKELAEGALNSRSGTVKYRPEFTE
jgi:putative acetyltransferase